MARDLPYPIFLDLPPVPNLSELKELGRREIEDRMLAACPSGWREIFKGMLDNANLHFHNLNLPVLLKELVQIRNHECQILNLQQAEGELRNATAIIGIYTLCESGPENPKLRGYIDDMLRDATDSAIARLTGNSQSLAVTPEGKTIDTKALAAQIAKHSSADRQNLATKLEDITVILKDLKHTPPPPSHYTGPTLSELVTYLAAKIYDPEITPRPWWLKCLWRIPYWLWIIGTLQIAILLK